MVLRRVPLGRAYDDAEKLADGPGQGPRVRKTGQQPYVYHDRTSSKVLLGAFNAPDDPAAVKLRETLLKLAVPLTQEKTETMIVPAPALTDLAVLKTKAQ